MTNEKMKKAIESRVQKLLKEFKDKHKLTLALDFRKHVYLNNNYGLSPAFSYDLAKEVVFLINDFLIEKFEAKMVEYNIDIDCNRLRTGRLKEYLENRIYGYVSYYFYK